MVALFSFAALALIVGVGFFAIMPYLVKASTPLMGS